MSKTFRIAPMSGLFQAMTLGLWLMPLGFVVAGLRYPAAIGLVWVAAFLVALYAGVWLWFRPGGFEVTPGALRTRFPLRTREIARSAVTVARRIDGKELRERVGFAVRIGAGGLWGGFGWLWTTRLGLVELYISRLDGLVWIERRDGRPLLITPEQPDALVAELAPSAP